MNGPPARISICTPVLRSGPVYVPFPASIVPPGPIRLYAPPCSGSGNQSVCNTILSGQIPLRLTSYTDPLGADAVAPGVVGLLPVVLLLHAAATSPTTDKTAAPRRIQLF